MDFDITRRQINWLWIIAFLLLCVGGVVYFFSKDIGIVLIWLPALLMIAIVPAEIAYRFPKFMDAVLMSFSALVGGLFIICLLIIFYQWADSNWIPHHADTMISAEESWFVGESKECVSSPLDTKTAAAVGKDAGYAVDSLTCDSGPYRNVKVTIYGRVNQPENDSVNWKCTREQDGFTCRFVTGYPKAKVK
jgi:hypothetical protein